MSAVFTNSAYLLSGVSAYAFANHIQVGIRKPRAYKHILFSLMCLCMAVGSPFNAITNSASSVEEYIYATKIGYTFVMFFLILISWFIPYFTGKRPIYFLTAISLFFIAMLLINFSEPYSFQYDYITNLQFVELPWGGSYTLAVGKISLTYKIAVLIFLMLISFLIYSLCRLVYRDPSQNNIAILLATIFLAATYVEAVLVRTGVINFLPLGTFGGLGLIIVMSMVLNKEHNGERNHATAAIARQRSKFENILKTANDGICVLNESGLLVLANDAFLNMLSLDKAAINRLKFNDWSVNLDDLNLKKQLGAVLKSDEKIMIETQYRTTDGKILDVEVSINTVDIDGEKFLYCASRDITERKILQRQLEQQARIDYLTQVNNRGYFMLRAEQEVTRANRYGSKLSLLMMDVDNFKKINDTYGHKSGDVVLQELSHLCRRTLRQPDIIGRVGGEEFAILLPETDENQAYEVAEKLRANIANTDLKLNELSIKFKVSIGIAMLNSDTDSVDVLLSNADEALYKAKHSGRNRVVIHRT